MVADQQDRDALGRLLQKLQQRIGGRDVHLVGRVHDGHAPPSVGRGEGEEGLHPPHLLDGDLGLQALGLLVPRAAEEEEAPLGQRAHAPRDRMVGIDGEAVGRRGGEEPVRRRRGQKEPRDAPGERGLAHAERPRDEPAVMQPPRGEGRKELGLGPRMAEERLSLARVGAPSTRSGSGISSCAIASSRPRRAPAARGRVDRR